MSLQVDCWDLDWTIVHTRRLYAPAVERVAEVSDLPAAAITASIRKVGKIALTFSALFSDLGLAEASWDGLEAELKILVALQAQSCLYPGVRELLEARKHGGHRQVLVTAGDPSFQQWKFELLGLGDIFLEEDRHYVSLAPRSKVNVIEKYLAFGPVNYTDDRADWLLEVLEKHAQVTCIRPCWSEVAIATPHAEDGRRWHLVHNTHELAELFKR